MPVTASFVTSQGTFKARLLSQHAPVTVANFVDLARGKKGMKVVEAISLIQTGPQDRPRADVLLKQVVIEESQD